MNRREKRIFATLFFAIFSTVTGVGIVVPLLPVYAHDLGASGVYIALIFGAFALSRTFFLPYFGSSSDRHGRKPYLVWGLLAYAVISLAFIFSASVESLIALRFIQGIASAMIMPVAQAYVGDITPEGFEGLSMGLFNMSVFMGLSFGPLLGGFIEEHSGIQAAFLCMGVLAFAGCLMTLSLLPSVETESKNLPKDRRTGWRFLLRDPEIIGLFFFRATYTASIGVIWAFLPVYGDTEFGLTGTAIGILVMLGVFVSGIVQTPMGFLADRMNRKILVMTGGAASSLSLYLFQTSTGFWDLFGANLLFGIGGGIAMPALMALAVVKGNQNQAMGSIMGLMTMAHSLGMMTGSLLAGLVMDLLDLRHAFHFGALAMVIGVVGFLICNGEKAKRLLKPT